MSRQLRHHDRGPPATTEARVNPDEVVVGIDLVVADPGLVVVGEDTVLIGPDEVIIKPEIALVRCHPPPRKHRQGSKRAVPKGSAPRPR